MKKYDTVKLFYNEYPYKIVIRNGLVHIFREKNLARAKLILDELQYLYDENKSLVRKHYLREEHITNATFIEAKNLYIQFQQNVDYKLRVEGHLMQVYSHDYLWLTKLSKRFNTTEFWEPGVDLSVFDKNTILVEKPPKFEYKIHLGDNVDPGLANWIISNKDKAKAGPVCLREIACGGFCKGLYFYARDEKILQLLNLFIGNVQRIDKLVYIAKTDK